MVNWLEFALLLIFLWIVILVYLAPRISKSKHFALLGPALMIKLVKNHGILDRIAKRFPGKSFGRISVVIVFLSAIIAMAMLVYGAIISMSITPANAPSLSLLIGLPGINPAIPIGFGAAALIISVVIHEVFHGIVARNHGIKVNSVGALFFVIPVGAFVEPDEKEIMAADPVYRRRIVAVGPGINIVLAIITLVVVSLLLVPAATPVHDGLYIESMDANSPAHSFISTGTELISFGNYTGNELSNIALTSNLIPGQSYTASVFNGKNISTYPIPAGLVIDEVFAGTPAYNASLQTGAVIISIDSHLMYNDAVFAGYLNNTKPGTVINLVTESFVFTSGQWVGTPTSYNITTTSKYDYYQANDPSLNSPVYRNQSFLGVSPSYAGMIGLSLQDMKTVIAGQYIFTQPWTGFLQFIALPFASIYPISTGLASLFSTPFYAPLFWNLVNMLYWLFWIDILLGITNALPLFVLDGGQFFRDSLTILSRRPRLEFLKNEKTLKKITNLFNVIVLVLLLWQVIVPRII